MSEITSILVPSICAFTSATVGGILVMKYAKRDIKHEIISFIEDGDMIEYIVKQLNQEEVQKIVYGLGALFAQGAKSGLNLGGKKSGKFGFTEMIMGIAGKYLGLGDMFGGGGEEVPALTSQTSPSKPWKA